MFGISWSFFKYLSINKNTLKLSKDSVKILIMLQNNYILNKHCSFDFVFMIFLFTEVSCKRNITVSTKILSRTTGCTMYICSCMMFVRTTQHNDVFPFKLSRDITEITPLWETPSLQPFLKTYWLTPVNDWPIVAKHANMTSSRGSINAAPATIRQNLFLHLAEPRLWLKMLQLTVKVRSFEGRPHGCSSAAFRWVWHFLKVVRLPSDQRWTFGTQVMSSCRLKVRIPLTVEPAGQDISPASHAPLPWRCGEPRADAGAKGSHVAADAARKNPLCKHAAPASERRSAVCKAQSLLSHSHDNTFTW